MISRLFQISVIFQTFCTMLSEIQRTFVQFQERSEEEAFVKFVTRFRSCCQNFAGSSETLGKMFASRMLIKDHNYVCRICREDTGEDLIAPCNCQGQLRYVHDWCLLSSGVRHGDQCDAELKGSIGEGSNHSNFHIRVRSKSNAFC